MQALALSGDKVGDVVGRLTKVEAENTQLKSLLTCLEARLVKLEGGKPAAAAVAPAAVAVAADPAPAPAKAAAPANDDDDDFDMFGDEEDDEEVAKRNAERVAAYQAKKAASNSELFSSCHKNKCTFYKKKIFLKSQHLLPRAQSCWTANHGMMRPT